MVCGGGRAGLEDRARQGLGGTDRGGLEDRAGGLEDREDRAGNVAAAA